MPDKTAIAALSAVLREDKRCHRLDPRLRVVMSFIPQQPRARFFFDYGSASPSVQDVIVSFALVDRISQCVIETQGGAGQAGDSDQIPFGFYEADSVIGDAAVHALRLKTYQDQATFFSDIWDRKFAAKVRRFFGLHLSCDEAVLRFRSLARDIWTLEGRCPGISAQYRSWAYWFRTFQPLLKGHPCRENDLTRAAPELVRIDDDGVVQLSISDCWITVNPHTARITDAAGKDLLHRHVALSRWHVRARQFRGRNDLLGDVICWSRQNLNNSVCHHRACELRRALADYFASFRDQPHFSQARRLSRSHAQIWQIARLLAASDDVALTLARFTWFKQTLPTLWRLADAAVLGVVAGGRSLRQSIPYWTSTYAREAARQPRDFWDARLRLLAAALGSITHKSMPTTNGVNRYAGMIGLSRPWSTEPSKIVALAKPMEAFVRCFHDYEGDVDWNFLQALCRAIDARGFRCPRGWGLARLARELEVEQPAVAPAVAATPYPLPAVAATPYPLPAYGEDLVRDKVLCVPGTRLQIRVNWIDDFSTLKDVARKMSNCLKTFDAKLRAGDRHIFYASDLSRQQVLAVWTLRCLGETYELEELKGIANSEVDSRLRSLVYRWLNSVLPRLWYLPKAC